MMAAMFRALFKSKAFGVCVVTATGGVGLGLALQSNNVHARDLLLHPPEYAWSHKGFFSTTDHFSARRGYQVYKQVCSACHSMKFVKYLDLVGVIMSEDEAKEEAAEAMVKDGPDDEGNYFERPGRLSDTFPNPYDNEEAAKNANNGALPPDLSLITLARHGGEDYVFSILTGYWDPPAGVQVDEGGHYNPYFAGGVINMAPALYDEIIEYDDGTPATRSQLAKDVCVFLKLMAERHHDEYKRLFLKWTACLVLTLIATTYFKRLKWSLLKNQHMVFKPKRQPKH